MAVMSALSAGRRFTPYKHYFSEEWLLLGCYAVWLL
jgi:hypothetical protein